MPSTKSYATRFRALVVDLSQKHESKKRDYVASFGSRDYELERYGQIIEADFFTNNIGHNDEQRQQQQHAKISAPIAKCGTSTASNTI